MTSLTKEEEENLFCPFFDDSQSSEILPDAQRLFPESEEQSPEQFTPPSYPELAQRTEETEEKVECEHREFREVQFCLICPRFCINTPAGTGFKPCHSKYLKVFQCSDCSFTEIKKNGNIILID